MPGAGDMSHGEGTGSKWSWPRIRTAEFVCEGLWQKLLLDADHALVKGFGPYPVDKRKAFESVRAEQPGISRDQVAQRY